MHCKFENVKGYATYTAAQKRGEDVAAKSTSTYRWVVIALPSGRFAPLVILNNNIPGGPGEFLSERNVCMAN